MKVVHTSEIKIPEKSRSEKVKDAEEKHLKTLTRDYFREAKDDSLIADKILQKYNSKWKQYCYIANKNQKGVVVFPDAFQKRIEFTLDLVDQQKQHEENETQEQSQAETEKEAGQETEVRSDNSSSEA